MERLNETIASLTTTEGSPGQQDENSPGERNLPEDIWCHIHSMMPMRDAARVACVSQAFARSWKCHPNLTFSEKTLGLHENACQKDEKMRDFANKVDHIMKNHSGTGVKRLEIQVGVVYNWKDRWHLGRLDSWLQTAVKPGTEELILSLSSVHGKYIFPCSLLSGGTGDSLRYLFLSSCHFHPTVRLGCLRSLTRLKLYMVHITESDLRGFVSNSFALELLDLRYCSPIKCLKIPCLRQLSCLEVIDCDGLQAIESKAPNICSFRFAGDPHVQLSLRETGKIRKLVRSCDGAAFYARTELPFSMPNLETLTILSNTEMVNTPMLPSKFLHLKFLYIALGGVTYDFLYLVSFFDASPSLETFILNVLWEGRLERVSIFADPSAPRMIPEHHHDKLKCVDIINFTSAKSFG